MIPEIRAQSTPPAGTQPDTDGDSLPDTWETNGITLGGQFFDLPALGANPKHKDVFVDIYWMVRPAGTGTPTVSFQPTPAAVAMWQTAFDDAPVSNPDGEPGIHLHLDMGTGNAHVVPYQQYLGTSSSDASTTRFNQVSASGYFSNRGKIYRNYLAGDNMNPDTAQDATKQTGFPSAFTGFNAVVNFEVTITNVNSAANQITLNATSATTFLGNRLFQGTNAGTASGSNEAIVTDIVNPAVCYQYQATGCIVAVNTTTGFTTGKAARDNGGRARTAGTNLSPIFLTTVGELEDEGRPATGTYSNDLQRALEAMHELGHTFGLLHGGFQTGPIGQDRKPNYVSIMSYLYNAEGIYGSDGLAHIDYSRHTLPTLHEQTGLNEAVGIRDPDGLNAQWWCEMPPASSIRFKLFTNKGAGATMPAAFPGAINWNCSGMSGNPLVEAPGQTPEPSVITSINKDTLLEDVIGFNDWAQFNKNSIGANGVIGNSVVDPNFPGPSDETGAFQNAPGQVDLPEESRALLREHPEAYFATSTERGLAPLSVVFDGSGSSDLQGPVVTWKWSFGDGTVATGSSSVVSHVYATPGIYVASLIVTDGDGNDSTFFVRKRIHVDRIAEPVWAMFGRAPSHHHRSPLFGPRTSTVRWTADIGKKGTMSSPAVGGDGAIYLGATDGSVYAVNPDGTQKWRARTRGPVESSPALSSRGDRVFVGSDDGRLYSLDTGNGAVVCFRRLGGEEVESSPVIGANGTVYVGAGNRVYAVDPATCGVLWSVRTGGEVESSPAVGPDGTIYVGSADRRLYAINSDGSIKWTFLTHGDVKSSPAVSSDGAVVYVGSEDRRLYAVSATTGSAIWSLDVHGEIESSPALSEDGLIYIVSEDGRLLAIAPGGTVRWSKRLGGEPRSSPAVGADGVVYVGAGEGHVEALNGNTGALVWRARIRGDATSGPAIGPDRRLYVGEQPHADRGARSRSWSSFVRDEKERPLRKLARNLRGGASPGC
jgi:outer membrane protein assembly factor BamB